MTISEVPHLDTKHILVLTTVVQHALQDPDYARDFIRDPKTALTKLGLTDADLEQVAKYTAYVAEGSKLLEVQCW